MCVTQRPTGEWSLGNGRGSLEKKAVQNKMDPEHQSRDLGCEVLFCTQSLAELRVKLEDTSGCEYQVNCAVK